MSKRTFEGVYYTLKAYNALRAEKPCAAQGLLKALNRCGIWKTLTAEQKTRLTEDSVLMELEKK